MNRIVDNRSPEPSHPAFDRALGAVRRPFPRLMEFAGLLALAVAAQLVVIQLLFALGGLSTDNPLHVGIGALAGAFVWIATAAAALGATRRPLVAGLVLGRPQVKRPWAFLGLAFVAGAASVLPSSALYEALKHWLPPSSPDLLEMVGSHRPDGPALVLTVVSTVIAAPLSEEIFFRGLSLKGLAGNYGSLPAAFAVSVMFAAIHFDAAKMPSIFLLSVVLCYFTLLARSVWPAVLAHAGYNGLQVAAWLVLLHRGEALRHAEGPEVGAVAGSLLLLTISLLAAWRLARPRPQLPEERRPLTE